MTWQEVCDDPSLQNLPYKIELDQWGRIVMSPASNRHGGLQFRLGTLAEKHMDGGQAMTECSMDTPFGTKVADAVWRSDAFVQKYGEDTPYPVAPEICIEVVSSSNAKAEIAEKIMLFLSKGALEVWICEKDGAIAFHDKSGKLPASKLAPNFPTKI